MKTILVYCPKIAGHRLEYLHHLYEGAKRYEHNYVFAVPMEFEDRKTILDWKFIDNISFTTIDNRFISQSFYTNIHKAFLNSKGLAFYANKYQVDEVIVLDMIEYVPFLPLCLSSKIKVKGIIYKIITYEWKNKGVGRRLLDYLKYWVMSKFKVYNSIYMLNDIDSPKLLNKKFKTDHFKYLPDPVSPIYNIDNINIRKYYNIDTQKKIILHPGGMLPYKGTLEILKALEKIPSDQYDNLAFIFAGRVTQLIKDEFYRLLQKIDKRLQVIVEDDFFTFERLGAFLKAADWILIPYFTKSQSSGIVGHAAFFKKPVIAVKDGLIGSIVSEYKLGVLLNDSFSSSILEFLTNLPNWNYVHNDYVNTHKIEDFVSEFLKD